MTREKIDTYKPRLKVMNPEQMWSIHAAALEILKNTGFEMKHAGAREMLLDAGCSLSRDGRVRLPARLVETALKTAPKRIQLYDQIGNQAMDLVDPQRRQVAVEAMREVVEVSKDEAAVAAAYGSTYPTDNAAGHGEILAKGVSDGNRELPDLQGIAITQLYRL